MLSITLSPLTPTENLRAARVLSITDGGVSDPPYVMDRDHVERGPGRPSAAPERAGWVRLAAGLGDPIGSGPPRY